MHRSRTAILDSLVTDSRHAVRLIRRSPVFSLTVIALLAAGIALSTAAFSIVEAVLLAPLPYRDPARLVQINSRWPKTGDQNDWSAPLRDAADWKAMVPDFSDIATYRYSLLNLDENNQPESLYGVRVSANLFPVLGVPPVAGRWFTEDEDRPGQTHEVILSNDLWRRRFGTDPQITGKMIHLNGEGYQVVGVMPPGFNFPLRLATTALLPTDQMQYWIPLGADLSREQHGNPNAGVIARIKPGARIPEAQAQLETAARQLEQQYPTTNHGLSARMRPLLQQTAGRFRTPLLVLLISTGVILVVACFNVATLLLARAQFRSQELAVRMALGAGTWRVARIPLLHGLLLSLCGCALGVPSAIVFLRAMVSFAPIDVPRLAGAHLDSWSMAFAATLFLLSGAVVAGMNSAQVLKRSPRDALAETSGISGRPQARLRTVLVIGQVALAVVVTSGAALMLRTFAGLLSVDTGYKPEHVLYGVNVLPPLLYPNRSSAEAFYRKVLDQLRAAPEVDSAGVSTGFPLVGEYGVLKAQPAPAGVEQPGVTAEIDEVSPAYLETMGVRLVEGRTIEETDTAASPPVAVVDEKLAAALWPGQEPLGKLVNLDGPAKPVSRQVVGVMAPTRNRWLDAEPAPSLFVPVSQGRGSVNFVVMKSRLPASRSAEILRQTVRAVDPNQSIFFAQSMTGLLSDSIAVRRFLFFMLAFFAASALILSAIGMYGLISALSAARVREIGIRMAVGARREQIAFLILAQGTRLSLAGAGIGLLASVFLNRLMTGLLFGVKPDNPAALLASVGLLLAASALATLVPALRSAKREPMEALRSQ